MQSNFWLYRETYGGDEMMMKDPPFPLHYPILSYPMYKIVELCNLCNLCYLTS